MLVNLTRTASERPTRRAGSRSSVTAAIAAVSLAAIAPAAHAAISFNPTGGTTTPTYTINGLAFGPGNLLDIGAVPFTVGSTFTAEYQTHLTALSGPSAPASVPGLNSTFQITEVASFVESVSQISTSASGTTVTFALTPSKNDQVSIYYNPAVVFNDAAGTGFNVGTIIASLTPTSFVSAKFTDATLGGGEPTTAFNQTGAGNGLTAQADQGAGSQNVTSSVVSYNPAFFQPPSGTPTLVSSSMNLNVSSVFDAISPSLLFTNPVTGAPTVPNIGGTNGQSGPDFQLQTSGVTQSFTTTAVPEPASAAVVALAAVAGLSRRRRARRA